MYKIGLWIVVCLALVSCSEMTLSRKTGNSVVYEMNVRQYTPEGTLASAQEELPRLAAMGVDIVWLMPIYPIGIEGRKGSLGSYYAVRDYFDINPEFGTMEDFDSFVDNAHRLGMKVIVDWVANHTSPDAAWVSGCDSSWYERDSLGRLVCTADWTDTANLNYENKDVWKGMQDAMRFWIARGVDGFRCDMACEVPLEFWKETIELLRSDNPEIYMLAEGEDPRLHTYCGFDATYSWELHHLLNAVARGEKNIPELLEYIRKDSSSTPADALRLMFTSNHDENSWAGTEFERMGDASKVMAVLTFTLPKGQPLIYTGQEIGWNKRFEFFEKDPVPAWEENSYTDFYKNLIAIRHSNPALASGTFRVISASDSVLVFSRELPDNKVTVTAELKSPWSWDIESE